MFSPASLPTITVPFAASLLIAVPAFLPIKTQSDCVVMASPALFPTTVLEPPFVIDNKL